jgi:hypothetical protein
MPWFRGDDQLDENPKQLAMSDAAFRVWVCSWAYCARNSPEAGFISTSQAGALLRKLRKQPKVVGELVGLRAWEQVDGGYLIHDWDEYVPKTSRDRTRRWRERKRNGDDPGDAGVASPLSRGDIGVASPRARDGYPGSPSPLPGFTRNPSRAHARGLEADKKNPGTTGSRTAPMPILTRRPFASSPDLGPSPAPAVSGGSGSIQQEMI